jgi:segregation and condensation protein A
LQRGLPRRAALAATFAASLELARTGRLELRQEQQFGPIFMRRGHGNLAASETANTEGLQ